MASNQLPVAEKARIISETFVVPEKDVERIKGKSLESCTKLEEFIHNGNTKIPFDMVREVQKKQVADCSPLELKIRYNDPDLGKLPNWVDLDKVDTIIKKVVNSTWTGQLEPVYFREDIYSACWEHILLKSKQICDVGKDDYERFICHLAKWHTSNFYYYHEKHSKYVNFKLKADTDVGTYKGKGKDTISRLPEVIYNLNEVDKEIKEQEKFVYIEDRNRNEQENYILDVLEEEMDMLNTIKSIKDVTLRDLLSIASYLLAHLDSFEELYQEAVDRLSETERKKFFEIIHNKDGRKFDFKKIAKIIVGKETNAYLVIIKDYLHDLIANSKKLAEV